MQLFTTTPQSVEFTGDSFGREMKRIAASSEEHGYHGILVYSDNRLADPWVTTCTILSVTDRLLPMIALQPVYMHPYTVAKKIATIGLLHNRKIALNLVAGGFKNDLDSLSDHTEHDRRYDRLAEYTEIIRLLLESDKAVSYDGEFYQIRNLRLQPGLSESLQPEYFLSGSSDAARDTADRLGASLIEYPEPTGHYNRDRESVPAVRGIRIGVLTREARAEAWEHARQRFPETRVGKLTHQMAMAVSDSEWHKRLSEYDEHVQPEEPVYWLGPFQHYHTFCPYLVGSYEEVSAEISRYLDAGCNTCILDIPVSESELAHTQIVFNLALTNHHAQ